MQEWAVIVLTLYFLNKYIDNKTLINALLTGFSLGITLLTKYSAIILPIIILILFLVAALQRYNREEGFQAPVLYLFNGPTCNQCRVFF